ncbi:MAG: chitinase [Acidobacteriota bacterium]|jgi:chitinase|nr:chitinase [Acidobacteriota bacterium]
MAAEIMRKTFALTLLLFVCLLNFSSGQTASGKKSGQQVRLIVAYLFEDRVADFPIKEIEDKGAAKRLTHIIYGFANISDGRPLIANEQIAHKQAIGARESVDGKADTVSEGSKLRGAFNQLLKLKALHPHLKVLISIGGASQANAKGFSLASRTEESRRKFVSTSVEMFIRGNLAQGVSAKGVFDGIDVDWEYPTDCSAGMKGGDGCVPEDKQNFTALLAEFRRQLDEQGKRDGVHYQLTIAGSPWNDDYVKYEWRKIHPLLDFINLMTYGLAPGVKTRPHSPLYKSSTETGRWSHTFNTDYAVMRYLEEGVPAKKIVMGVPFYGQGWEGVPDVNNGLYQKAGGEVRFDPYNKLKALKGFRLFRDKETQALWMFNPKAGVFWSFDDPVSLSVKMEYVKRLGLGGVMFWELSGDDEDGSLLKAIYRGLHQ